MLSRETYQAAQLTRDAQNNAFVSNNETDRVYVVSVPQDDRIILHNITTVLNFYLLSSLMPVRRVSGGYRRSSGPWGSPAGLLRKDWRFKGR